MRDYADDLEPLRAAAARGDADAIEEFNRGVTDNDAVRRMARPASGCARRATTWGRSPKTDDADRSTPSHQA